jgi:hypothetical protein
MFDLAKLIIGGFIVLGVAKIVVDGLVDICFLEEVCE